MYDTNIVLIEQLIQLQKTSLRYSRNFSFSVIGLGLLLLIFGQLSLISNPTIKTIISSGATVIIAFSGISIKELFNKKDNISLYFQFKSMIELYKENPKEQERLKTILQNKFLQN